MLTIFHIGYRDSEYLSPFYAQVHLDTMDVAGDNQVNIENSIFKQRLSPDGDLIGNLQEAGSVISIVNSVYHSQ